jgi:AcrR family transcriptional regulator
MMDDSVTRRRKPRIPSSQARERIAAATERLLAERPYRELSVGAVMAAAGLPRTVFYRHYDGLPEVVLERYGTVAAQLADELASADGQAVLRAAVDAFATHGPLMRAVHQAAGHDAQIEAAERQVVDGFTATMAGMLEGAMEEGRVRRSDAGELARALNLMNYHYLLATVGTDPGFDRDAAHAALVAVWEAVAPG